MNLFKRTRLGRWIHSLGTVGLGAVMTLVAAEYVIRVVAPQPINYYDFEVRDGGAALVAGSVEGARNLLSKGQGPYRPGHEYMMGNKYLVRINANGWRDVEHTLAKPPGRFRIGVIGDSVTFGTGVAIEDAYFRVLEKLLHDGGNENVEVLAFAGGATNSYFAKTLIEHVTAAYELDAVILGFNQNDIVPASEVQAGLDAANRAQPSLAARLAVRLDRIFRSDSHLFHLFRERVKAILRRVGVVDPSMTFQAFLDIEDPRADEAWADTRDILLEIEASLRARGVPLMIVMMPVDMQVGPDVIDLYKRQGFTFAESVPAAAVQGRMAAFTREEDILFVDPLPSFRVNPDEVKFIRTEGGSVDWAHLNARGHALVARAIAEAIGAHPGFLSRGGRLAVAPASLSRTSTSETRERRSRRPRSRRRAGSRRAASSPPA
jgi:lysophospholipase L1-like esterase